MANEKNLKPFKKGKDPRRNLKGKPKGKAITTILKELMDKSTAKSIMDLPFIKKLNTKKTLSNGEALALRLMTSALVAGDVKAMKEILDRLEGKSKQSVEFIGKIEAIKIIRE